MSLHCCHHMSVHTHSETNGIVYNDRFREYTIVRSMPDCRVGTAIVFCPWCGSKLPQPLRQKYFERLRALGHDIDIMTSTDGLPPQYRDGSWWRDLMI